MGSILVALNAMSEQKNLHSSKREKIDNSFYRKLILREQKDPKV